MKAQNDIVAKVVVGLSLIFLLFFVIFTISSLVLYEETYEDCLSKCKEKYQFNIDNSWIACEERCDKKHRDRAENESR